MERLSAPRLVTALLGVTLLTVAGYAAYLAARPTPVPVVGAGEYVVRVDARKAGWQPVGIAVERGTTVRLAVVDGQWTHFRGQAAYNSGAGGDYICAEALPASACIEPVPDFPQGGLVGRIGARTFAVGEVVTLTAPASGPVQLRDRKSTRLNSSHANISYAAFCLKQKFRE